MEKRMGLNEYIQEYEAEKAKNGQEAAGVHVIRLMVDEVIDAHNKILAYPKEKVEDPIGRYAFVAVVKEFIQTLDRKRSDWAAFAGRTGGAFRADGLDTLMERMAPELMSIYHKAKKEQYEAQKARRSTGRERF